MIFVMFVLTICLCLMLSVFNVDNYIIAYAFTTLSTMILMFYIFMKKENRNIKMVLLFSLFLRIVLLIIDLYYFRLPHAGADDDYFYNTALDISNNYSLLFRTMYGGIYPKILSIIFLIIGKERLGVQFINVILSMFFLGVMNNNIKLLNVKEKTRFWILLLISFMPNGLFLGCILRREIIISLLIALSINNIIKWFKNKNNKYAFNAFLFSFLAALFHSAVLIVPVIILIYWFLYDFSSSKISFKGINFIKSVFLILVLAAFLLFFINNFQNKFTQFDTINDVYSGVTYTRGNSTYLSNLVITNIPQLILYTPIKAIYFLISPMIWSARGVSDIVTILLDSLIYLILIIKVVKCKPKNLSKFLFILFVAISALFGLGTFTSGTAVRHRYNVLPFLIMSYASIQNIKKKEQIK